MSNKGGEVVGEAIKKNKVEYIDKVHGDSKGWITRSCIDENGYSQWHYKYLELKETDLTGKNIYITLNTFFKPCRRLECIKELNFLYIDLDYYKTKYTKEQVIMNLEENYFNKIIPATIYILDSGRGLALLCNINKVTSKALHLWKAIQEYLYKQLKEFGADRQALDATRILRVPGSINSKSKTVVSIIDEYDYIYDLREIQKEYLPELKPKEKKKGRPKKINYVYRERSLYFARIQDIIKLCELREYDLRGHREIILFLYRYYLCGFTEDVQKALEDVLELNSMFRYPLKENEVIRATMSAEKCYLDKNKEYKYKNDTLIELLEITEYEETYMSTIISKNEYKRRHREREKNRYLEKLKADGKIKEKDKLLQRRIKIKDLLAEGLEQKDICLRLNISKRTYIRDRKYLREQGLI